MMPTQVTFGKGFEYACLITYYNKLKSLGMNVFINNNTALETAEYFFSQLDDDSQKRLLIAADVSVKTLINAEPNLSHGDENIELTILKDKSGADGDVRDIIFLKNQTGWKIGISCKHNHHALKHSRLSKTIDFGQKWFGIPVSQTYYDNINPIFDRLQSLKDQTKDLEKSQQHQWSLFENKEKEVYQPILDAFRQELLKLTQENDNIPLKLVKYLLGRADFYKIIAREKEEKTVVQAFNIHNTLSQPYQRNKARSKTKDFSNILPTTIYHFDYKPDSKNTLILVMDNGWTISFRIHNASSRIEPSLKFDIQLIGFPSAITNIEHYWED